jgi:hypothetical protein
MKARLESSKSLGSQLTETVKVMSRWIAILFVIIAPSVFLGLQTQQSLPRQQQHDSHTQDVQILVLAHAPANASAAAQSARKGYSCPRGWRSVSVLLATNRVLVGWLVFQ